MQHRSYFDQLRGFLTAHRTRRSSHSRIVRRRTERSPFTLEPVEPRVLLSADLTGVIAAHTLQGPSVLWCPVCDEPLERAGRGRYHWRPLLITPIHYCSSCDIYCRDVSISQQIDHYNTADYCDLDNEKLMLNQRKVLFEYILSLIKDSFHPVAGFNPVLVDFGSAYGHLLDTAKDHGYQAIGIEAQDKLVRHCRGRGLKVQPTLDDVPGPVDVFTMIDSLYYDPNPKATLSTMRKKLSPGGLLLLRMTNRHLYARVRNLFARDNDFSILGDIIVSYSHKGISSLLHSTGFEVTKVLPDSGKGKRFPFGFHPRPFISLKIAMAYRFSYGVYALSGGLVNISPGMIVLARPVV